ncbi:MULTISPECIES: ABC transporter permease [Thalassospira]|jgi:spermidine/putrescine transport system permease protein|uniref:ABC transporter permease n=3 Tax=Thalassospira TaxID=168934 RepID=A0ABR5XXF1_9PROT|nr:MULTISPECIES: ABC transporter permease [Thalassospira]MBR9778951.1 ABC transporter permease [Rhodospirillales bacterium]AJD52050.1 spermidine/putrescine ABC transporter permease II [Thalassospira xiamenensis M-5 = DSM 17429]KEO50644.1 ABC transporter permease [Thalassospira permensis NBRC 106175]KZC97048.1 ABC transporter permease [Thalassospira xiamenensis]KZD08082.1 ABC transporter permease [Thalassospira xiamenensis]|tara:strand:+ start:4351 stop:5211 length:861 start_codon:yes stop_codon:yes gene_type:complete
MIPSIPQPRFYKGIYAGYIALFFIYLSAPLIVVGVFAFNDSLFPSMPWEGGTLKWFFGSDGPYIGIFNDGKLLESVGVSAFVAFWVTLLSVTVGTCNAFLFERAQFPGKNLLYVVALSPLVIPGVILGISILVFSNAIANGIEEAIGWDLDFLRPGLFLVIIGQFAFITTITTLVISARLRKFDISLEEAALNLGATRQAALWTVTIPFLKPALIGAGIVAFLMSFENFNTTLMLVGSDAPLTIAMFDRLKQGSTPVLNALSLLLMVVSGGLALLSVFVQRDRNST